MNEIRYLQ